MNLLLLAPQLANDVVKGLFDIDTILGRRFNEIASELLGECTASVIRSHLLPTNMIGAGPYDADPSEEVLSGEPGYEGEPDCDDSFTR